MYERLIKHFVWPNMFTDVRQEINSCPQCRRAKITNTSRKDRLKTVLAQLPFEILYVENTSKKLWEVHSRDHNDGWVFTFFSGGVR